ncbi:MAG TPA: Kiwa anti-phage protein KwaB-like domain-containing protein [Candidatus Saccharimonadales bacterium]
MSDDILAPDQAEIDKYQETDVFLWANNLVQYKDELQIDLFFINRNYVLHRMKLAKELKKQLEPLFIDSILEYVLEGAQTGLIVRGFEEAEAEEHVLQRTQLFKVDKARDALNFLKYQEKEIDIFKDEEHDISRMRGIVARVTHPSLTQHIFVIKALPRSNVMSGRVGWMERESMFMPFDAGAVLRVPQDNQLLVLDQDLYVFSEAKLKSLFGYDAKEASIAEAKVEEIETSFRLSYPEGMSLQTMIAGKKSIIKKLQKIDPKAVTQQALLDHADELGIELMADDSGAIILMEKGDVDKFVNLLNDDYMESPLTGQRYEIVSKRPIKEKEDDAPGA